MSTGRFTTSMLVLSLLACATGCTGGAGSLLPSTHGSTASSTAARRSTADALISGATTDAYSSVILNDGALAYYRLTDTATTLADSGSHKLNGTYGSAVKHGGAVLTSTGDKSATFPGGTYDTTNFATVPASATLQPTTMSVEAWVSEAAADTTAFMPIVEYGRDVNGSPYLLQVTPLNTVEFSVDTSSGTKVAQSSTVLVPGVAYQIVGTYDGSAAHIYVDGALQSSSGTGSSNPAYSSSFGLAIGGGNVLEGHKISFTGGVSDVSVYSGALSAAKILNHYTSGVLTPLLTETPKRTQDFINSIGVNTHISDVNSLYVTQYSSFKSLITGLGIRHIRDAMPSTTTDFVTTNLNDLGNSGIHSTLTTDPSMSDSYLEAYPAAVPTSFEAYEGPNEPDDQGVSNWAAPTKAFMERLHNDVVKTAAVSKFPVIAPALVSLANVQAMGNIGSYVSYGNMHNYFSGYNPGTTGWGSLCSAGYYYGSIAYDMWVANQGAQSRPIMSTETGYGLMPPGTNGNVSSAVLAKYVPRLYFDQFGAGIARTFIYEFYDQNDSGAKFTNYGLVDLNGKPKPSYNALKSIIAQLQDNGSTSTSFTPKPFSYTISGDLVNVKHMLLEKSDGTYVMAIWIEAPSWDVSTYEPITVAPQSVTLSATSAPLSATSLDSSGNQSSVSSVGSGGSVTFTVTDQVTLLSYKP